MTPASILAHHDRGTLWPVDDPASRPADVAAAYRDALAVRRLREARGERVVGYKIGFTNRTIWERYRVHAPIWGPVWNTTLTRADGVGTIDLAATCQPRIEPEIVFGLGAAPPADATLESLFACVDWLAPGFEIVQSHRADWRFSAADTVADGALHARLLVGTSTPVARLATSGEALDAWLAAARVRLFHDDRLVDEGIGSNVLDGPLHALLHFVHASAACAGAPTLRAGDVVTTGTWTDAWPVAPGQHWRATFDATIPSIAASFR